MFGGFCGQGLSCHVLERRERVPSQQCSRYLEPEIVVWYGVVGCTECSSEPSAEA